MCMPGWIQRMLMLVVGREMVGGSLEGGEGGEDVVGGIGRGGDGVWGAVFEGCFVVDGAFSALRYEEDTACQPLTRRHLASDFGHRIDASNPVD